MYYENYNENQGEEKAFIKWINSLGLSNELGESIHVNNLYEDLKTGLILLNIIDKIKPGVVNWKYIDKNRIIFLKKLLIVMKLLMLVKY